MGEGGREGRREGRRKSCGKENKERGEEFKKPEPLFWGGGY